MSSKISVCEKSQLLNDYLLIVQSHFLHREIIHDLIRKLKGQCCIGETEMARIQQTKTKKTRICQPMQTKDELNLAIY